MLQVMHSASGDCSAICECQMQLKRGCPSFSVLQTLQHCDSQSFAWPDCQQADGLAFSMTQLLMHYRVQLCMTRVGACLQSGLRAQACPQLRPP